MAPGLQIAARMVHSARVLEEVVQDLRYGIRTIVRNPVLAAFAIVSLALATGATTAIFSVVNSVLLRPLPFADPPRLVDISGTTIVREDLEALRRRSTSFESFGEYSPATFNLQTDTGVERVTAVVADRALFDVLGARPALGRTFRKDDPQVAIISEQLWVSRFGRADGVIGAPVILDGRSFVVVGVMPASFQFPYGAASVLRSALAESRVDVWVTEHRPLRSRVSRLVARLRRDVLPEAAAAEIAVLERNRPSTDPGRQGATVSRYSDVVLGSTRPFLWLLSGAVALVLAAACANVANLLLALTTARMREVATRAALGASRARLVRQFMLESLLIAFAGGSAGLLVGKWAGSLIVAFGAQRIPRAHDITFDWTVFAFLFLVCMTAAVVFGTAPALAASRVDAVLIARERGHATAGRRYGRARDALVVIEVALAFVLATGAALVVLEMERLRRSDNGMQTANVLTLHLAQPMAEGIEAQYYDIAERVERIPGVSAAGFTQVLPLQNWGWSSSSVDFVVRGTPPPRDRPYSIELRYVTPGYFEALGIPIVRGRGVAATDTRDAPRVILINETLAQKAFGTADPVGVEMNRGRIVGVVGDVRQVEVDRPAVPEMYFPMAQNWAQVADLGMTLVVRTAAPPAAIGDVIRSRVADVNPGIAIFNMRTMEQVVRDSLWDLNLYRWLIGWFAGLTLILSAVGLYGVVSFNVTARQREWAIRLALGSTASDVVRLVLKRGILLAAAGIAAGLVLVVIASQTIAAEFPAPPNGGVIYGLVASLMFLIALCAAWLPARRVVQTAPAAALREE